jgi:hypothetical protein
MMLDSGGAVTLVSAAQKSQGRGGSAATRARRASHFAQR